MHWTRNTVRKSYEPRKEIGGSHFNQHREPAHTDSSTKSGGEKRNGSAKDSKKKSDDRKAEKIAEKLRKDQETFEARLVERRAQAEAEADIPSAPTIT